MLHHRTTNPAKRAEHITDRLERQHYLSLFREGWFDYDWPRFWLKTYNTVLKEFTVKQTRAISVGDVKALAEHVYSKMEEDHLDVGFMKAAIVEPASILEATLTPLKAPALG